MSEQAPIELIVSEVKTETIEVRVFGANGDERAPVEGPIYVRFQGHNVNLELNWTYRGEPPELGSLWTLTPKDTA